MSGVEVIVVFNHIPRTQRQVVQKMRSTTKSTAKRAERIAKRRAPVQTGFLRDHIEAVQVGPVTWTVESGADYSTYQEYGTRYNEAHLFMTGAALEVGARLEAQAAAEMRPL